MEKNAYEMPDEYKKNLAHLTDFIETREGWRVYIKDALARGVSVSLSDKAMVDEKLREFDSIIDGLETALAKEYEQIQAEMAKDAEFTKMVDVMWEKQKQLYIIIKHQTPHMLESFTECLDPLTDEQREQFLDEVAILESTQLQAILNGSSQNREP